MKLLLNFVNRIHDLGNCISKYWNRNRNNYIKCYVENSLLLKNMVEQSNQRKKKSVSCDKYKEQNFKRYVTY